ncbi:metallophosphoesterase [Rhizobium sp. CC-YZS058]|uniref:metallophosphoesterase n=1 Tax=Rhizobium sp. CC-YZS058 TaxID=3042153 RepID=UPI002B05ED69|nr:metallophosphoesterase [Rhizobium sp. CC-YZS058]MEA3537022.1 metallophosphoesterase [Rhizobium sp. CC-YZS058]
MLKDDVHTFAIGDVHGRADLLRDLLEGIRCKARTKRFKYRVVFLGDIIDRGPDSRGAMDLVIETLREVPGSELILGNHESLLLRVIDEGDGRFYNWFTQGGMETLRSYGHPVGVVANSDTARQLIPDEHIGTMRAAAHYVELPDYVLVHAGIRPGVPLEQQDPYDLMWIRAGFLDHMRPFRKLVVHGHSPTRSKLVEQWPGRIAIDTGACRDGRLSTLHIQPSGGLSVIYASGCAEGGLPTTTESVPTCMELEASTEEQVKR